MSSAIQTYDLADITGKLPAFEIRRVKNAYERDKVHHLHRHNYYSVILHLKGTAGHILDFNTYTVDRSALICITPQQVHMPYRSEKFEAIIISFTKDFLVNHTLFPDLYEYPNILSLNNYQKENFLLLAQVMLFEYDKECPDERILRNLLDSFIILVNELTMQHIEIKSDAAYELALNYKQLVNSHFIDKKKVADYAALLHVTASHLNDTVKKVTGRSAKQLIIDRLITEAKRLLYFESLSIKEIAAQLDFTELNYFNSFFKKYTGTTPLTYRITIRKKYN